MSIAPPNHTSLGSVFFEVFNKPVSLVEKVLFGWFFFMTSVYKHILLKLRIGRFMETFVIEDYDYIHYTVTIVQYTTQHVWLLDTPTGGLMTFIHGHLICFAGLLFVGRYLLIKGSVQYSSLLALFRKDYNQKFDVLYRTAFQGS